MTPTAIADFMASFFTRWPAKVRLLDPGIGIGSLTEAFSHRFFTERSSGSSLEVTGYEIEPVLMPFLARHMGDIQFRAKELGVGFSNTIHERDFIGEATFTLRTEGLRYTHAILNPPYKKIGNNSKYRKLLREVGIETVNLYAAFLGLAVSQTEEHGEIVAIVPRSFCNGTYFRPFRRWLLERTALRHIHVFESRVKAFKEDDVLQENIIIHLERAGVQDTVTVSTSHDSTFSDYIARQIPFEQVVRSSDPELFIHIPTVAVNFPSRLFSHLLADIGLEVSTGPVVDFRLREYWLQDPKGKAVPLLYAHHFKGGKFRWPCPHRKPNALVLNEVTRKWLMPRGWYTLIKRFSAKEEARRLVAYVLDPESVASELIGFENHLNVVHKAKIGLPADLAHGFALFLNSTLTDQYFRELRSRQKVCKKVRRHPSCRSLLPAFRQRIERLPIRP